MDALTRRPVRQRFNVQFLKLSEALGRPGVEVAGQSLGVEINEERQAKVVHAVCLGCAGWSNHRVVQLVTPRVSLFWRVKSNFMEPTRVIPCMVQKDEGIKRQQRQTSNSGVVWTYR